jgi:hypothetical protein
VAEEVELSERDGLMSLLKKLSPFKNGSNPAGILISFATFSKHSII